MRRSSEKVIAVQLLTLIVALPGLLSALLQGDTRCASSPASALWLHGMAAGAAPDPLRITGLQARAPLTACSPVAAGDSRELS